MKNSGVISAVVLVALLYLFRGQITALFSGASGKVGKPNQGVGGVGSFPPLNSTFQIAPSFVTGPGFRPGNVFGTPSTNPADVPIFGSGNQVSSNTSTVDTSFDPFFGGGPGL